MRVYLSEVPLCPPQLVNFVAILLLFYPQLFFLLHRRRDARAHRGRGRCTGNKLMKHAFVRSPLIVPLVILGRRASPSPLGHRPVSVISATDRRHKFPSPLSPSSKKYVKNLGE